MTYCQARLKQGMEAATFEINPNQCPKVTVIDSRNLNEELNAVLLDIAENCEFCVMKADYSTMGTPGLLLSKDVQDKYNTLKYMSTYGCLYSWSIGFWTRVASHYESCTFVFNLFPGERTSLNGKNREYLQKTGTDFNLHALYGLRYIPGLTQMSTCGVQYLFTSIMAQLSNKNINLYCYNGINELTCLYNMLYVEIPESITMLCKDLSYFNIFDLKPFYANELNITKCNHLVALYAAQIQENKSKNLDCKVICKYFTFKENKSNTSSFGIKSHYSVYDSSSKTVKSHCDISDYTIYNPLSSSFLTSPPIAVDNFYCSNAFNTIAYATGESNTIDTSHYINLHNTINMSEIERVDPFFNSLQLEALNKSLSIDCGPNSNDNTINSNYSYASHHKCFQIGFLVANLLQQGTLDPNKHAKKLHLLSRDTPASIDLESPDVIDSNYSLYHSIIIGENKLSTQNHERRKDVGSRQYTEAKSNFKKRKHK